MVNWLGRVGGVSVAQSSARILTLFHRRQQANHAVSFSGLTARACTTSANSSNVHFDIFSQMAGILHEVMPTRVRNVFYICICISLVQILGSVANIDVNDKREGHFVNTRLSFF